MPWTPLDGPFDLLAARVGVLPAREPRELILALLVDGDVALALVVKVEIAKFVGSLNHNGWPPVVQVPAEAHFYNTRLGVQFAAAWLDLVIFESAHGDRVPEVFMLLSLQDARS